MAAETRDEVREIRDEITASALLREAARHYDAPGSPFARTAPKAWHTGFASAAAWMELALDTVRAERAERGERRATPRRDETRVRLNALGLLKNGGSALLAAALGGTIGLATRAALSGYLGVVPAVAVGSAAAVVSFVVGFYAIEGQMVFLFPLVLDGRDDGPGLAAVFAACRAESVRAGGTLAVMRVVMPISARMVFGGFFGQGFLRSWCLGCLAVVIWYEKLDRRQERHRSPDAVEASA